MKQKNPNLFVVLVLLLALLLVACGGGDGGTEAPADSGAEETAAEPAEEEAMEEEAMEEDSGPKIFTFAEAIDPTDIDPRSNYDGAGVALLGQLYETLTHYNPPGSDPEISPELAVSWESNDDATEWTFQLREGVTFHDGEPFNAEAVKILVENVRDGELATSWVFGAIAEIEVVDEHTVKFINAFPAKLDLIFSSAFGAWMVSPKALENDPQWFQEGNSAGTGPYKITDREPGTRIVLSHHEDYWGGWNDNKFDTIAFEIVPDAATREQMIRSGDADLTYDLDFDNIASLQEADGVNVFVEESYNNQFIMLNNAKPPLDNPLVRQALVASYPYQEVLDNMMGGLATAAGGAIPQSMWGADKGAIVTQDLEKAKELLAEAGMADGFELEYWAYDGIPRNEQIGEIWGPALRELNIELKITTIDFNAAMESFWNDPASAHHAVGLGWFPTYVTPFDPLFSPFSTGEYFNVAAYDNPEFTELLFAGDGVTATDTDEAIALFQQANQMIVDDGAAIFVFDVPAIWYLRDDLDGFYYSPAYGTVVQVYDLER